MEKVEAKSLLLSEVTKKVIANSLLIEPQETITLVTEDPDDNKILACAKAGKVDYIISQDAHLLKLNVFESIPILTPEEFLRKFM
jgi:predicted nucleic acid-binding protein